MEGCMGAEVREFVRSKTQPSRRGSRFLAINSLRAAVMACRLHQKIVVHGGEDSHQAASHTLTGRAWLVVFKRALQAHDKVLNQSILSIR
jgi:hypothetical protein